MQSKKLSLSQILLKQQMIQDFVNGTGFSYEEAEEAWDQLVNEDLIVPIGDQAMGLKKVV